MHSPEYFEHLLQCFLDNDLDAGNTQALFAELSKNPSLQHSLQLQMLMRSAASRAQERFKPPQASTDALFARLGLQQGAATTTASSPAMAVATSAILSRSATGVASSMPLWVYLVGSIASSMCASLLTLWLFGGFISRAHNNGEHTALYSAWMRPVQGVSGQSNNDGNDKRYLAAPTPPAFAEQNLHTTDTVRERIIIREIIRETPQHSASAAFAQNAAHNIQVNEQSPIEQFRKTVQTSTEEYAREHPNKDDRNNRQQQLLALSQPSQPAQRASIEQNAILPMHHETWKTEAQAIEEPIGVQAEVRGILGTSLPRANIGSGSDSPFKNSIVGLRYVINQHHSLGLEVGSEEYFQQYLNITEGGVYRISQNPLLTWTGISYRFSVLPDSHFSPFGQITLGATRYGGLGRTMLGVSYAPESRVRFILGAEASTLLYQHQSIFYSSSRVGLSYGVSVTF